MKAPRLPALLRIAATLIDGLLMGLFVLFWQSLMQTSQLGPLMLLPLGLMLFQSLLLLPLCEVFTGRSPGKWATGLIVELPSELTGPGERSVRLLLRHAVKWLPICLGLLASLLHPLLGGLILLVTALLNILATAYVAPDWISLPDRACRTRVLDQPILTAKQHQQLSVTSLLGLLLLLVLRPGLILPVSPRNEAVYVNMRSFQAVMASAFEHLNGYPSNLAEVEKTYGQALSDLNNPCTGKKGRGAAVLEAPASPIPGSVLYEPLKDAKGQIRNARIIGYNCQGQPYRQEGQILELKL